MNLKLNMMLGLAKGFIPPVPKEHLNYIASPKYELSQVIISGLNEYKEQIKKESNDLYEMIRNLTLHFVINYEKNEETRIKVDSLIDKIVASYLERRKKISS